MADEDLSDEQLRQLLRDAEQRLRGAERNQELQLQTTAAISLPTNLPKITAANPIASYIKNTDKGAQIDSSYLVNDKERRLSNAIRVVQDPVTLKTKNAQVKKSTAGEAWFNLPRTVITPELKRDLQLLRMRSVLDPKRHYKKEGSKPQIPEFSQVGTIIEGPTEYFSARLLNKDRKQTFIEEVLAGESTSRRFRNKYGEIQAAKTSGRKEHYKNLKAKRSVGHISKG